MSLIRSSSRNPSTTSAVLAVDRKPWALWSGAGLLTLLVHLALIGSLTLGTGPRATRPPPREGVQTVSANADGAERVSVVFFIEDTSIHVREEENDSRYTMADANDPATLQAVPFKISDSGGVATPPSLDDLEIATDAAETPDGDGGEAVRLFGLYLGQMQARIERAWAYTGSTSAPRHCRVQIRQSRQGEVQDILVQRCDLNAEQQMSLVRAIQQASPLSAPPSEKVFTELVTLNFSVPSAAALPSALAFTNRIQ